MEQVPTKVRPRRGEQLELTVDSLAYGGEGVARLDGYVVFVADAIHGDRVRAVVGEIGSAPTPRRAIEILEPSPDRIEPRAAHPAPRGRCSRTSASWRSSRHRWPKPSAGSSHLNDYTLEPIVPAVAQWRYRNKLEYSFGADATGALICGFHAPGRWDEIVEVTDCMLASERANAAGERVVQWCREQGLAPYDRRTGEGLLRNLVVREGRRSGQLQVRLVTGAGGATWIVSAWRRQRPATACC